MQNFLFGFLFAIIVAPFIENLMLIIQQLTKHICTMIAAKTYQIQQSLEVEEEPIHNPIGFRFEVEEEDEDEGEV